ncbi:MAG TPA: hypothetical protein VMT94_05750 [Burkholderiales bacterium]|nr:hypothetical protein [Burkholderiales bacterium]
MTGQKSGTGLPEIAVEQLTAARADLEQMRAILASAIEGLVTSFTNIALLSNGPDPAGGARPSADWSANLLDETRRAMTCLQFQDMLDQLLTQACDRLDLATDALSSESGSGSASGGARHRIVQRTMDPGDVDLF